ncbi:OmpP1/FadL family transporter [Mucilaginibacter sp. UR6-11]|uniref:OmpP1/FadL family transporter n=1 Tax=Mucilaginibacter sp. UR6-11 TaxID=1435644 RepID=UPI001E3916F4|nr:outer membrane protein transport protein [Mucilaginibacter sp. UR6-11]MCC8426168.1 outer membrane protein transport protein [Mucilaginibacter sp. UR6-11]
MRFKYLLYVIALLAISNSSFAQYAKDAIRFSTFQPGSTSRIKAIGNAGTAIGGDLSSISGNPAGLGYFTHSELSLTPEFDGYSNNAAYLGQTSQATKNNINFSNASVVFYSRLNTPPGQDKTRGWLSLNFGMGYSRTNNFDERVQYGGKNSANSINDYYASLANSQGVADDNLQAWALSEKLIDAFGTPASYSYASNSFPGVQQTGNITRTGGQTAYDFSLGANYSNKLYLGFGIGLTDMRYKSTSSFNETGSATINENGTAVTRNFNSTYSQYQTTKGSGFNARLGVIYKVIESIRLGAAITTPTFISIDDSFSEGLENSLSSGKNYSNGPVEYPLSYSMRTPFKAAGGVSVFLGQYGFITGDVEYIDYSSTHINSNDNYTNTYDNGLIKANYRSAINAHAGAELKLGSALALRGGYGIQGSPLKTNGTTTKMVTGGLGYRVGNYYADAAYVHLQGSQNIMQYDIGPTTPVAGINATNNNFFLTIGLRY